MTSPEGIRDIRERSLDYALRTIALHDHLQGTKMRAAWTISGQLLRSATSIGANLEEALGSESRADFSHKNSIALKEARESLYWLTLLHRGEIVAEARLKPLMQETGEIVAILTTIVRKTKRNPLANLRVSIFSLLSFLF